MDSRGADAVVIIKNKDERFRYPVQVVEQVSRQSGNRGKGLGFQQGLGVQCELRKNTLECGKELTQELMQVVVLRIKGDPPAGSATHLCPSAGHGAFAVSGRCGEQRQRTLLCVFKPSQQAVPRHNVGGDL